MKLHIGCGKRYFGKDWIHIDGGTFDHVTSHSIYCEYVPDNSVDVIYASHLIAYLSEDEFSYLLNCWKRVLKEGGTLRLATPDFDALAEIYVWTHSIKMIEGPLYGKMKMGDKTIYHKKVYDFNSLATVLHKAGFKDTRLYNWRETEHAHIDDHSQAYMLPDRDKEKGTLISLNVECVK